MGTTILLTIQKGFHLNKEAELLKAKSHQPKNIYNSTKRNFRDLLERKCQELNMVFMPGKTNNGRILYKIGLHWCYLDRDVIHKNVNNEPISFHDIESLNSAQTRNCDLNS